MIMQIVYTSRPSFAPHSEAGKTIIEEILAAAQIKNATLGITGHLLITGNQIAQILEGESLALWPLLRRITSDERHKDVRVVESRYTSERNFPRTAMEISLLPSEGTQNGTSTNQEIPDLFALTGPEIIETAANLAGG